MSEAEANADNNNAHPPPAAVEEVDGLVDPVTATDADADDEASTAVVVVLYPPIYLERVSYVMYFGDDAVDLIYFHLTPQELVRCAKICRLMRTNMPRVAERLVKYFLKRKYFSSPHVRVPTPGEVLYQDDNVNNNQEGGVGAPIVAASYLRQYRDMTKQRVMLMGG